MPNLALLILGITFFTQLVSWIGRSVLQELAFSLYSRIFLSSTAKRQRAVQKQVLEDKAELARTSSQDEFAKWAKLKRKVDKGLADLEKINSTLTSSRTSFSLRFSSLLWTLTTGAQLVTVWWYRKQPVFYLPPGWVPAPVAWVLSFPSAPRGSISSAAWGTVCKRVLTTLKEIVMDLLVPLQAPVPVAMPASTANTANTQRQEAKIQPVSELEHEKLD